MDHFLSKDYKLFLKHANEFMKWSGTIKCKSWVRLVVRLECEHKQTRERKNRQSETPTLYINENTGFNTIIEKDYIYILNINFILHKIEHIYTY